MHRRQVLVSGGVLTLGTIAGCLGGEEYPTETFGGTAVPLAPLEDVYAWYENDEVRFVDTRSRTQYERSHVDGAVFSPAPDGLEDDPVTEWPTETRIVTYCRCPHTLAGQRAASLIDDGYEEVYAIDEGYGAWLEEGYPIDGEEATTTSPTYEIYGEADPDAGEYVWLRNPATDGHLEVSPVETDGSYELSLYADLKAETVLEVAAPDYTLEAPLSELTSGVVTGQ